jgi:N-acetylglucosaminyldiphosphoundecaprenol N-acetyl-beta-D-mannosaminyltransferase
MPRVASAGLDIGLRHFFFGGPPGLASEAGKGLEELVPGTQIAGSYSPPFTPPERWNLDELQELLQSARPNIVWVGLGAPRQELWMAATSARLDVPVFVGVGAAFDFLAGTKCAAPRFLSRMGLEWLFSLLSEPRRLWHRYLVGNSRFAWMLFSEALKRRRGR